MDSEKDTNKLHVLDSYSEESDSTDDDDEKALKEFYGESSSDDDEDANDDDDFEEEYEDEVFPTDSRDSFMENIIFEHTLKHSSFFENVQERRRRHLENRLRGTIPMLHFTGTHRTEFWGRYGIEVDKVIPPGNVLGINDLLSEEEFKKLGPTERRIHVNGQKFKIVPNVEVTNSMYRAIAQAMGMAEEKHGTIRTAIHDELIKQWPIFCTDICAICGKVVSHLDALLLNPKKMVNKYKKQARESGSPQNFELVAAALHYGFSFSVMDITTSEQPTSVQNCTNERVLLKSTAKYHFLKTGKTYCYYEFLLPIGPLKKIPDGVYPTVVKDVILVEKSRFRYPLVKNAKPRYHPSIGPVAVGFALDHRIFLHRSTISHDLWSLLAELIFRKLIHAPQIKSKIIDNKHEFALYYLACKAKKRYQVRGNASVEKLAEDFTQRFSKENPRGDLEDLVQAAHYFDFSYTVIGLDFCGNFFWRDNVSQHEVNKRHGPYLAFFVKTTPDRTMFWYALEDVGRACPKEKRLYQDVMFGDLSQWGGKFYFHYTPTKANVNKQASFSARNVLKAPTRMLSQATKWATSNFGKLRSTLVATVSTASVRAKSMVESIRDFFSGFTKKRHTVRPADEEVEALFVRNQP